MEVITSNAGNEAFQTIDANAARNPEVVEEEEANYLDRGHQQSARCQEIPKRMANAGWEGQPGYLISSLASRKGRLQP